MYEEIYAQAKQACNELCDVDKLKEGYRLFFKRGCMRNYLTQFKS